MTVDYFRMHYEKYSLISVATFKQTCIFVYQSRKPISWVIIKLVYRSQRDSLKSGLFSSVVCVLSRPRKRSAYGQFVYGSTDVRSATE